MAVILSTEHWNRICDRHGLAVDEVGFVEADDGLLETLAWTREAFGVPEGQEIELIRWALDVVHRLMVHLPILITEERAGELGVVEEIVEMAVLGKTLRRLMAESLRPVQV